MKWRDLMETPVTHRQICDQCGKLCYSQKEAGWYVNNATRRHWKDGRGKEKKPVRYYYCEFCKCYHLTSQSNHKKRSPYNDKTRRNTYVAGTDYRLGKQF